MTDDEVICGQGSHMVSFGQTLKVCNLVHRYALPVCWAVAINLVLVSVYARMYCSPHCHEAMCLMATNTHAMRMYHEMGTCCHQYAVCELHDK